MVDDVPFEAACLPERAGKLDTRRRGDLVGHLRPEELLGVDEALTTVLAFRWGCSPLR